MSFNREDCEYIKFNIENHKMEFSADEDGILISIPFSDDTTQCIKDKLNDIIYQEMNRYLETVECMSMPCNLKLNARMQINYDPDFGVKYYIAITITDFELKSYMAGICIDKDALVNSSSELCNEFVAYCRNQLDGILFPVV